jgi:hypothetical protein
MGVVTYEYVRAMAATSLQVGAVAAALPDTIVVREGRATRGDWW